MILNKIYKILRTLTGYRSRPTYWSHSSIARGIQKVHGFPEPIGCGTSKQFREWDEAAKAVNPFIFWVTEEGFDHLQNIFLFIPDVYSHLSYKARNTLRQSNCITTGLPIGGYYEIDTLIEEGLFNLIVEYVEIEQAHMYDMSYEWSIDPENDEPEIVEELKDRREAGLAHLEWEINLTDDMTEQQSLRAEAVKDIYLFIKDVIPNRPDPHEVTGWSEYCDSKTDIFDTSEDEEERLKVRKMLKETTAIQQEYKDENTKMLTRIVEIRDSLWT